MEINIKYSRKNIWDLSLQDEWHETILWFARGVAEMKKRPLDEVTGWRFYAGVRGFNEQLWAHYGYLDQSEKKPSAADQDRYWRQCQHGSWYFLPWHRGYVIALEANIRAAVIALGGPSDWAIPYWNYFKTDQYKLPPAFASKDWPDGTGNNPLFTEARFGPDDNDPGNVYVPMDYMNLNAMNEPKFTGVTSGGATGFGGIDTGFSHGGKTHGKMESMPHDMVHVYVGGQQPGTGEPGLMAAPPSAALDPIFYLHHANIDRLWESWRVMPAPPTHDDPTQKRWLGGPQSTGERNFSMPMPDGTGWDYTPTEMADYAALNFEYDDLSAAGTMASLATRLQNLGASPEIANAVEGAQIMSNDEKVELLGVNKESLNISGTKAQTRVHLDGTTRRKVSDTLMKSTQSVDAQAPDRVFLNLENITGSSDSTVLHVYVNLTAGENPDDHPELLAGSVALFGLKDASDKNGEHAGQGLTSVIEITEIVDRLHLENTFDVDVLHISIVPHNAIKEEENLQVGRISMFRQGG